MSEKLGLIDSYDFYLELNLLKAVSSLNALCVFLTLHAIKHPPTVRD